MWKWSKSSNYYRANFIINEKLLPQNLLRLSHTDYLSEGLHLNLANKNILFDLQNKKADRFKWNQHADA